ncbi:MAG: tRNA dihydrouridine synthase DusB [Chloroflexi bacterium]|nr:tRNA dihydrouridine synthase DusB [Chloroflexota bacterium]
MKLKIGSLVLENPLIMAPLSGYCDSPYRRLAASFGCALTYSGLISSHALSYNNPNTVDLLASSPEEKPVAFQIFGFDPALISRGAAMMEEAGADVIDLNAGCGVPKVFKSGSGMALCRDLKLLEKILKTIVRTVSVPVIIKTRTGFHPGDVTVLEVAKVAEYAGVSAIAIHPRFHSQKFGGKADHTWAEKIKQAVKLPVIGSGDLNTPGDVKEALESYGYDGVMLGRGALGNPWLYSRSLELLKNNITSPPPSAGDKIKAALYHLDLIEDHYPSHRAVKLCRLHITNYIRGMRQAGRLRDMLNRMETTGEIRDLLENIPVKYDADPEGDNIKEMEKD